MDKAIALEFFGGIELTAHAMGVSGAAVRAWESPLSNALSDRVIGAAIRSHGWTKTRAAFPKAYAQFSDGRR